MFDQFNFRIDFKLKHRSRANMYFTRNFFFWSVAPEEFRFSRQDAMPPVANICWCQRLLAGFNRYDKWKKFTPKTDNAERKNKQQNPRGTRATSARGEGASIGFPVKINPSSIGVNEERLTRKVLFFFDTIHLNQASSKAVTKYTTFIATSTSFTKWHLNQEKSYKTLFVSKE